MNQTIQDGIGEGRIADCLVPVLDWQLTCDDGGGPAMAVFEDFQKVTALRGGQDGEAPIIDDQHLHARKCFEDALVAAITPREGEGFEHAWGALVEDGPPIPTSLMAKCAGDPALADAAGAGDQEIVP